MEKIIQRRGSFILNRIGPIIIGHPISHVIPLVNDHFPNRNGYRGEISHPKELLDVPVPEAELFAGEPSSELEIVQCGFRQAGVG